MSEQWVIRWERLGGCDVECCAGDVLVERFEEGVYDSADVRCMMSAIQETR